MSYTKNSVSILIPTGGIVAYTGIIDTINNKPPPTGWLLCDGTGYSSANYNALYNVIGQSYGSGNGSTTNFNVPNYQAAFLRGAGTQTYPTGGSGTVYVGNSLGSGQATYTQSHTHPGSVANHTHTLNETNHTHTFNDTGHNHSSGTSSITFVLQKTDENQSYLGINGAEGRTVTNPYSDNSNSNITSLKETSAGITSTSNNSITITVGNNSSNPNPRETIPFNYAINWIIKY